MIIYNKSKAFDRYLAALNSISIKVITPSKGVDMWAVIEGLVADYITIHRDEIREIAEGTKILRMQHLKRTGATKDGQLRHALCLPPGLMRLIEKYYPDFFKKRENIRKMMRRFPGFRVPERI